MMNTAEFLYPSTLEVTPIEFQRILMIGTCVATMYLHFLRPYSGTAELDHLFFNNLAELPDNPPRPVVEYDFQLILLPLRDVVTDRIIRFSEFNQLPKNEEIRDNARATLKAMLAASLKYNRAHSMMTFVSNFTVPSLPISSALDRRGSQFDFTALVQDLNRTIRDFIADYSNVYLLDVDSIGNTLGKRYFSDDSFCFYFHAAFWSGMNWEHDVSPGYNAPQPGRIDPLPKLEDYYGSGAEDLFRAVWRQMVWLYRAVHRIDPVKLVIFDLDDTLWRGQIAEHYQNGADWPVVHGWPLGIWEAVQHFRARGILVAICSKNLFEWL